MLPLDVIILFVTRGLRMFAYGAISVVMWQFLQEVGLSTADAGLLLTSIVLGDLVISLFLTSHADATLGRKRTLAVGAALMCGAGLGFVLSGGHYGGLLLAGTLGVISSSGGEIGPFLPVEQAALCDATHGRLEIGPLLGYYSAMGYAAQALGALCSGWVVWLLEARLGWPPLAARRTVFLAYACLGGVKVFLYSLLSAHVECPHKGGAAGAAPAAAPPPVVGAAGVHFAAPPVTALARLREGAARALSLGLHTPRTRAAVARVSALFVLDAFAGGLVMQSFLAAWFARVWGWDSGALGSLLMAANVLGGLSSIVSGHLVARYGAVATAVFTHLPSNVLLACVPLMPSSGAAAAMLLARFCLSQMDVPARQAFVQGLVAPSERSAAGGVTNVVRSLGLAAAPLLLGALEGREVASVPFFLAAALKTVYDIGLYRAAGSIAREGGGGGKAAGGAGAAGGGGSSSASSASVGAAGGAVAVVAGEEEGEGEGEGEAAALTGAPAGAAEGAAAAAAAAEAAAADAELDTESSGLLGQEFDEQAEAEGERWLESVVLTAAPPLP